MYKRSRKGRASIRAALVSKTQGENDDKEQHNMFGSGDADVCSRWQIGKRERSENKFKLKTVLLQNKSVRGDRKIFVGKVAVFSHVLNWRIKFNYRVHCCQWEHM